MKRDAMSSATGTGGPVPRRVFLKQSCALAAVMGLTGGGLVTTLAGCDTAGPDGLTTNQQGLSFDGTVLTVDTTAFPDLTKTGGFLWLSDVDVIIVHTPSGEYRAFDSVCPHEQNNIRIYEQANGTYRLRCPSHDWTFDLDGQPTGKAKRGTTRYPLTQEGNLLKITIR